MVGCGVIWWGAGLYGGVWGVYMAGVNCVSGGGNVALKITKQHRDPSPTEDKNQSVICSGSKQVMIKSLFG